MPRLSDQQSHCVDETGNVVIIACPGSGKTRVLTYRVARELDKLEGSRRRRVAALTFTRKAADEMKTRIDRIGVPTDLLWTGTIHSFALDWIIRPYAAYSDRLRYGFRLLPEREERELVRAFRREQGLDWRTQIQKALNRHGRLPRQEARAQKTAVAYHRHLEANRLIDFDLVLYLAFQVLESVPTIPQTLGAIFQAICIDEYQDTQDLQYGILASIARAAENRCTVFVVGDPDQAIYTSLGGVAKSTAEIKTEFGISQLAERELTGNYRSSQRLIDFYSQFGSAPGPIESLVDYAEEPGLITFENQTLDRADLPDRVSALIRAHIARGVPQEEICVLAPQWRFVTGMARALAARLEGVQLNAPGLSPFAGSYENIWFRVARLVLTEPEPRRYYTRLRWAGQTVRQLQQSVGRHLVSSYNTPRGFLRLLNSLDSDAIGGCDYLTDIFASLVDALDIDLVQHSALATDYDSFFDGARLRLADADYSMPDECTAFRRCFGSQSGVVIDTCHGVKGQEYDAVICYGLLFGYVPNWNRIYPKTALDELVTPDVEARRLLYVIASRAKRYLHLISEWGHFTRNGSPYDTTHQIPTSYAYD